MLNVYADITDANLIVNHAVLHFLNESSNCMPIMVFHTLNEALFPQGKAQI